VKAARTGIEGDVADAFVATVEKIECEGFSFDPGIFHMATKYCFVEMTGQYQTVI